MPSSHLRFLQVPVNGITLNVVEAGALDGPIVILLHGFPEFWYCWRDQIAPLADAGFHVLVPDQRGYNRSDKPHELAAYDLDLLAGDILGLAARFGAARFCLAGHDWGALVGWWIAQHHPERLERFVALAGPHPAVWREHMESDPSQRRKSTYVRAFRIPLLPELAIRRRKFGALREAITATAHPFVVSKDDIETYRKAWAQPGALTGSLNWYRAILNRRFPDWSNIRIKIPTVLVWGMKDIYADAKLAEESIALCERGELVRFPKATHWLLQDEPSAIRALLSAFFKR